MYEVSPYVLLSCISRNISIRAIYYPFRSCEFTASILHRARSIYSHFYFLFVALVIIVCFFSCFSYFFSNSLYVLVRQAGLKSATEQQQHFLVRRPSFSILRAFDLYRRSLNTRHRQCATGIFCIDLMVHNLSTFRSTITAAEKKRQMYLRGREIERRRSTQR